MIDTRDNILVLILLAIAQVDGWHYLNIYFIEYTHRFDETGIVKLSHIQANSFFAVRTDNINRNCDFV